MGIALTGRWVSKKWLQDLKIWMYSGPYKLKNLDAWWTYWFENENVNTLCMRSSCDIKVKIPNSCLYYSGAHISICVRDYLNLFWHAITEYVSLCN
jgi:hypothetical protein